MLCVPLCANVSEAGCQANQDLATRAAAKVSKCNPNSIRARSAMAALTDQELDRLRACSTCPVCSPGIRNLLAAAKSTLTAQWKRSFGLAEAALERNGRSQLNVYTPKPRRI